MKNSNHVLSLEEIADLQQQSLNISYDAYPLSESLRSLDRPLMEKLINKANTTGRVNLRDDYVSSIRNKLLAESFYLIGEIEKYGTGFVRIRQWLKDYPSVSFALDETGDHFRVVLTHVDDMTGQAADKYRTSSGQACHP